jgi:SAM-dependent methyltransferase
VRTARYDGVADWYDETLAPFTLASTEILRRLLGCGPGRCLDLCCGTGLHIESLVDLGWTVTGVDLSADQLRRAQDRIGNRASLVLADATELPFADGEFDAVVSMYAHTDVDDFPALLREAARVLRQGGQLVFGAVHPCFVGPHSRFVGAQGVPTLFAGYRDTGRYTEAPGISPEGLRARVGAVHVPLGEFVQAFVDAGFVLEHFEESEAGEYPHALALRLRR